MASLSKAEYLKRYLSADSEATQMKKKRRKKKVAVAPVSRIKIFDDDIDLKALVPDVTQGTTTLDEIDEAPTVADFVDERPDHVKHLEVFQSDRWKVMTKDKETSEQNLPPRRQRHDSDSDSCSQNGGMIDMPGRHDSDSDHRAKRTSRHDSDSDQSPPRTKRHDSDSDQSHPRTKRRDSDSDQSPPRTKRHDSDSDQSPPRKRTRSDSDQSPVRKTNGSDSDQSPPRRKSQNSDSDQSPARRKRQNSDSDQSPPRKKREENVRRPSRWGQEERDKKMKETLSGKKAGLSSAKEMKHEMEQVKQKENEAFKKIDAETLGKHAATVVRGRRRKIAEENEEKAQKMAEREKKYESWGQGLKQQELRAENLADHMHEMDKPLARHTGDDDLESLLKEKERDGDPMAAFMRKKKSKAPQSKKKEYPVYKGPQPPPNRYGLRPGYRWDGVDRSTGFEKKIFAQMASKKAREIEAYKWSIEDM
ncbi:BUD13 homolog [Lineus longissimus]|uniref:BUD13 homolog n=1 Tax=Lineus longissimus TaxID=88925 RepID=UPI002B4E6CDC